MCRRWPNASSVGDCHTHEFHGAAATATAEIFIPLKDGFSEARAMVQKGAALSRELMYQLLQNSIDGESVNGARDAHLLMVGDPHARVGVLDDRLIQLFACCSSLFEASLVFCMVAKPGCHTWHAILSAHAGLGFNKEALYLFGQMQSFGIKPSQVIFLCILKACGLLLALAKTFLTHFLIVDSKFNSAVTVGNSLIDTYAKCGSFMDALGIFEALETKDIISWNALMAGYALNNQYFLALECFCEMQDRGVEANAITFSCILNVCGALEALLQARLIHRNLLKSNVPLDIVIQNTLIATYIRCHTLDDAYKVFKDISCHDIMSWNTIIAGCCQHKCNNLALELFAMMQQVGLKPDRIVYADILKVCTSFESVRQGMLIHAEVVRWNFDSDVVTGTNLVDMYSYYACLDEAFKVFDGLQSRDLVSWNTLIRSYVQQEQPALALLLFYRMHQEHVEGDEVTCQWIVKACGSICAIEEGRWIHDHILKGAFESNVFVESNLVYMYVKLNDLAGAKAVLGRSFNSILLNTMIASYAPHHESGDAEIVLDTLHQKSCMPELVMLSCILKGCAVRKAVGEGMLVHDQMIRSGLRADIVLANSLVNMYVEFGDLVAAQKVFDDLPFIDVVSWNTLIGGYSQHGLDFFAIELFGKLQQNDIMPDSVTCLSVLKACSSVGALVQGRIIHDLIIRNHIDDLMTGTALVDMYAKCGALQCAQKVLYGMPKRTVVSWGALISGFGFYGLLHFCRQCLEIIESEGLLPDERILQSVLAACSHLGQVEEGRKLFKAMQEIHGLSPGIEHCSCMVDILCRAGYLPEAKEFLRTLPVVPDIFGWMSLFTACRLHGNKDLARFCFDRAVDLDPTMAGTYLAMLDAISGSEMWTGLPGVDDL